MSRRTRDTVAPSRLLQLKEILDRIGLPPLRERCPNAEAMSRASAKRWRLPGTEIDIALKESGPRAGECVVTAAVGNAFPNSRARPRNYPTSLGRLRTERVYRRVSWGSAATIYDAFPLARRVGAGPADPLASRVAGLGQGADRGGRDMAVDRGSPGLACCLGFVYGAYRLSRRLAGRRARRDRPRVARSLTPVAIILVTALPITLLCTILRIGGTPRMVITFIETGALYLSAAWLAMVGAGCSPKSSWVRSICAAAASTAS